MSKFKNGDIVICKGTFGSKPLVFIGVAENLAYENDCVVLYNDSCIPIQLKNLTKLSELACFSSVGEDDAAVHAINSHDAMAEQIKELKAALVEVLDCVDQDLVEDADSVRLEKAFCFAIKALKEKG